MLHPFDNNCCDKMKSFKFQADIGFNNVACRNNFSKYKKIEGQLIMSLIIYASLEFMIVGKIEIFTLAI